VKTLAVKLNPLRMPAHNDGRLDEHSERITGVPCAERPERICADMCALTRVPARRSVRSSKHIGSCVHSVH
jgi:hypothetical protein